MLDMHSSYKTVDLYGEPAIIIRRRRITTANYCINWQGDNHLFAC